ncbi:unnamed protein product [Prunus armeniaca]|uniref:Uncharacterized protein n=1 Tax=Prunus armeniaca TaxID=36596 RepID=A0A6J5TEZ6_PRUAR|nr:unnamed protein product [Prunus armeniaca]
MWSSVLARSGRFRLGFGGWDRGRSRPGFRAGNLEEPGFVEAWSPVKCSRAASGGAGLCKCSLTA